MKKHTTRTLKCAKGKNIQMLTCYDFQTAQMLNTTDLDLILVGDSLGNVVLGFNTTVEVQPIHMKIFGQAVRRGAPDKFIVLDMPFGSTQNLNLSLKIASDLFQKTQVEALKIEGAYPTELKIIKRLTEIGIPVMGHIGLVPQSVHQMGGYYTHGKNESQAQLLLKQAMDLEAHGCFAIVLECVEHQVAQIITSKISIPTIGIGSGDKTDGQVLVINDLLQMGPKTPPQFCQPIAHHFEEKKNLIARYIEEKKK